jgi:hypothetical protein
VRSVGVSGDGLRDESDNPLGGSPSGLSVAGLTDSTSLYVEVQRELRAGLAHAHHVQAIEHAANAAKEHLKAHGKK